MFDYHIHSKISFDCKEEPLNIINAAEKNGLKEICFTDHYDFNDLYPDKRAIFSIDYYKDTLSSHSSDSVKIRFGVEFGLTHWNVNEFNELIKSYNFDYVLGSVHYAGGFDPYQKEYWEKHGIEAGFENYLIQSLECVKAHNSFDVLGHINYACKSPNNPTKAYMKYCDYSDICDEIFKTIISKDIGIEINTSGVDKIGDFLPSYDYIKRFKELGGEIITVGSDAHDSNRVGQHIMGALEIAKDIFGYVCTFENRKPIFHKL